LAPYAVGIVKLEEDAKLPGIIKNVDSDKIQVGMKLAVGFEKELLSEDWPQWPRYCFTPSN
jgi:uncharacterized OB-fold protein